jgi:phosphonate transport system permease protein
MVGFFKASLYPEISFEFLRLVLRATLTTLAFAVSGLTLSVIFGFILGIFASEVWWESRYPRRANGWRSKAHKAPWLVIRSGLAFFRSIHEIVWALFFVAVIGLDPLTAILAIAIPFGAIIGKIFSEILDETPKDPLNALLNSGISTNKAFLYSLLPQASNELFSYSFYRFECAIRAAAVLGIIGAGGLGYEIFLSLQTLKFEQIWTLLFALFLLNGLVDLWSSLLRRRLGSRISCTGACSERAVITGSKGRGLTSDPVARTSLIIFALLIPLSFWFISPDITKLTSPRTAQNLSEVAHFSIPPDFSGLEIERWVDLSTTTLAMSILAIAFASIFALLISFPAANNFLLQDGILYTGRGGKIHQILGTTFLLLSRGLLLVFRSIPAPIWALILLYVMFPGILPGAIALGIYTLGVLGRLTAESTENLDDRPLVALKAGGASGGQVFAYGALPPVLPRYIGYIFYRWEEVIRATVVVGLVGAGGLGRQLVEQISSFNYPAVLATLIIFIGVILLVDLTSGRARRAFR